MDLKRRVIIAAFEASEDLEPVIEALAQAGFERPLAEPAIDNDWQNAAPKYFKHNERTAAAPIAATEPPILKGTVSELDAHHADTTRLPEGLAEGGATGALFGGTIGLLMGVTGLAFPGLIPAFATGAVAPAATGVAVGATLGGIHGLLRSLGIGDGSISQYAELIGDGYHLLSIRCVSENWETKAIEILKAQGAYSVSIFSEGDAEPLTQQPKVDWELDTY